MAVARREPIDFRHQVLRLDLGIGDDRRQGMLGFPAADLGPPGLHGRLKNWPGSLSHGDRQGFESSPEHALDIADDGHIRGAVLSDFRGIDVHVDDLGVRRESG